MLFIAFPSTASVSRLYEPGKTQKKGPDAEFNVCIGLIILLNGPRRHMFKNRVDPGGFLPHVMCLKSKGRIDSTQQEERKKNGSHRACHLPCKFPPRIQGYTFPVEKVIFKWRGRRRKKAASTVLPLAPSGKIIISTALLPESHYGEDEVICVKYEL